MDKLKTVVSFYTHSTLEESRIVDVIEIDGHSSIGIITQETPFHPENFKWKDQPSDRGQIQLNNQVLQIEKALIFCSKKGRLLIGDDINGLDLQDKEIPFGVIHIVNNRPSTLNIKNFIGQTVTLSVDQDYRESLSMAHTASHLVALALNNTLSQCWKKEYALDCLGNKNFDQAAISYSNITPFCSIDKFRLGKSTKRRGVDVQYIVDNINEIEFKVNEKVNEWLALQSTSEMTAIAPYIDGVRTWHCYMGDIKLTLPCGGTHVQSINVIKNISVSMLINDKGDELTVKTEVRAK